MLKRDDDRLTGPLRERALDALGRVPAFWQAHTGASREYGGLGIGQALTRHLIEMHGGTIDAASAGPARGATFTVMSRRRPRSRRYDAPSNSCVAALHRG